MLTAEGPLNRIITKFINLLLLNLLWIIFSLPIITIGASTSAMYYIALKMVKEEDGYIIKSFWKAFKQNFKQATMIELILVICGVILIGDIRYFIAQNNLFSYFFAAIFAVMTVVYAFVLLFVFPLLAKYSSTIRGALKNAIILSLTHLPTSISMTILLAVMLYGFYVSVPIMIIVSVIGVSVYAYVGSILFRKIFEK